MEERIKQIIKFCCTMPENVNPIEIFKRIAKQDFIRIHGPEHHILDGACILTAFYHGGGQIDLKDALEKLAEEGKKMPGAICGLWGVCGSVTSIGAALAIIDGTGPLTEDCSWGGHMQFTAKALEAIGKVGGPRCCKRDAVLSMLTAIKYINDTYDVKLDAGRFQCEFSSLNEQCIQERCPFYGGRNE